MTPAQVAIRLQVRAGQLGLEKYPCHMMLYRVLNPIIEHSSEYKLHCEWGTYGVSENLCTDGGKYFRSEHLKQIGFQLGFECHLRDRHQLRLLTKCTNCETPFPIPADWVQGECPHCFLPFATMAKRQKRC